MPAMETEETRETIIHPQKSWEYRTETYFYRRTTNIYEYMEETGIWEEIQSPQYLDFKNVSAAHDSYFELKRTDDMPPQGKKEQKLPGLDKEDDVLQALQHMRIADIRKEEEDCSSSNMVSAECDQSSTVEQSSKIKDIQRNQSNRQHLTTINPFSFDKRDKYMLERKQDRINKILMAEKKAREFHANPLPSFLKKRVPSQIEKSAMKENTDDNASKSSSKSNNKTKEIWKKPPFQPQKTNKPSLIPKMPVLRTEIRSRERQRFEERIKEKENELQANQTLKANMMKKLEQEEVVQLRKNLIHKAHPIRRYKIMSNVEKRPLTDPITPICTKRRRRFE